MAERLISPRLTDIVDSIGHVREILANTTLEAFEASWEKRWLVERGAEIISEASRHLPDEDERTQSRNPLAEGRRHRHVIRHNYQRIAPDVLWKLASDDAYPGKSLPRGTNGCDRKGKGPLERLPFG